MKDNVVEKKKGLNLPLTAVSVGFLLIVVLCLAF